MLKAAAENGAPATLHRAELSDPRRRRTWPATIDGGTLSAPGS
jgi:hypothetical protein